MFIHVPAILLHAPACCQENGQSFSSRGDQVLVDPHSDHSGAKEGEENGKMTETPSRRRSSGREACTVSVGTWVALLVVITGTLGPRREELSLKGGMRELE